MRVIWDYSQTSNQQLLVLLAMADMAGCDNKVHLNRRDIEIIAQRTRITTAEVKIALETLVLLDEVSIGEVLGDYIVNLEMIVNKALP